MDKYDEAIEWLVANPTTEDEDGESVNQVYDAWGNLCDHRCGCLFEYAMPSNIMDPRLPGGRSCGCLTMIRDSTQNFIAWTPELTAEIKADVRIPDRIDPLMPLRGDELRAALQPFAEWQRRLDKEIRGAATV